MGVWVVGVSPPGPIERPKPEQRNDEQKAHRLLVTLQSLVCNSNIHFASIQFDVWIVETV
jgi:hypothetical protein